MNDAFACFIRFRIESITQFMARVFDIRLAAYAEQLNQIIGSHEALLEEYETNRAEFNCAFKKVMFHKIRPVMQYILDLVSDHGHWIEIHTLSDERWRAYVHQCYTIHWTSGKKTDIAVVANYDYRKVFFYVEQDGVVNQLDLSMHLIFPDALSEWFSDLFPLC